MPLLSVDEAQRLILSHARPLAPESVSVLDGCGRVLARTITSAWDLPTHDLSVMDGYAVRTSDLQGGPERVTLQLVGESAAGSAFGQSVEPGQCVRIATGAVVPAGADAVIAQEDTSRADHCTLRPAGAEAPARSSGAEFVDIDLLRVEGLAPGKFVRKAGRELQRGDVVLEEGTLLQAGDLALAGTSGHAAVEVHARPRVKIISTGSELVPLGLTPPPGSIVSTNGYMLRMLAAQAGADAEDLADRFGDAPDDRDALRERLQAGLSGDVLITSGGISVGDHDLVYETLTELGCRFALQGVSLRPGKPMAFGVADRTLVFALPGNPASAFVTFELFVRPVLRRLLGVRGQPMRPLVPVTLATDAPGSPPREHYVRATLDSDGRTARVLPDQMSGSLVSLRHCDVLIRVPSDTQRLPAGSTAQAIVLSTCSHERSV